MFLSFSLTIDWKQNRRMQQCVWCLTSQQQRMLTYQWKRIWRWWQRRDKNPFEFMLSNLWLTADFPYSSSHADSHSSVSSVSFKAVQQTQPHANVTPVHKHAAYAGRHTHSQSAREDIRSSVLPDPSPAVQRKGVLLCMCLLIFLCVRLHEWVWQDSWHVDGRVMTSWHRGCGFFTDVCCKRIRKGLADVGYHRH